MVSTWTHKGIEITLTDRGSFIAAIQGKNQVASSLDAMKKRIDDATRIKFKAFKALDYSRDAAPKVFEVIGIGKTRGRGWGSRERFVTAGTFSGERQKVTPDTLEARKAIKAWQVLSKKNNAEMDRMKAAIDKAQEAIPVLSASDYSK